MASNFDLSQEVEDSGPRFSAVVLMRVVGGGKMAGGVVGAVVGRFECECVFDQLEGC